MIGRPAASHLRRMPPKVNDREPLLRKAEQSQ